MMLVRESNIYPQNTYTFINHFISLHYDCFYSYEERIHKNLIHFNIYVFLNGINGAKMMRKYRFQEDPN